MPSLICKDRGILSSTDSEDSDGSARSSCQAKIQSDLCCAPCSHSGLTEILASLPRVLHSLPLGIEPIFHALVPLWVLTGTKINKSAAAVSGS